MAPLEIESHLRALLGHEATEEEIASFLTFLDDEILRISASDDSDEGQKQRLVSEKSQLLRNTTHSRTENTNRIASKSGYENTASKSTSYRRSQRSTRTRQSR